jgi:hypothetical protein
MEDAWRAFAHSSPHGRVMKDSEDVQLLFTHILNEIINMEWKLNYILNQTKPETEDQKHFADVKSVWDMVSKWPKKRVDLERTIYRCGTWRYKDLHLKYKSLCQCTPTHPTMSYQYKIGEHTNDKNYILDESCDIEHCFVSHNYFMILKTKHAQAEIMYRDLQWRATCARHVPGMYIVLIRFMPKEIVRWVETFLIDKTFHELYIQNYLRYGPPHRTGKITRKMRRDARLTKT